MKLAFVVLLALGLSACALMERHPRSGYTGAYEAEPQNLDIYSQRRHQQYTEAEEELGFHSRSLEDDERSLVEMRLRLKRAENKLATKKEKKQYYGARNKMHSDGERLNFLTIPTYEARERFLNARGLASSEDENRSDLEASVIEANDISLGMSQKAVLESWGDPDAVEKAGDPVYGYERWKYNRYVSGSDGYSKELRVVYFESGHVVGWERPQ